MLAKGILGSHWLLLFAYNEAEIIQAGIILGG